MTMTSEIKKDKRNSVNRFFSHHGAGNPRATASSSITTISHQPSSTATATPPTSTDEGGKIKINKKRQRSIYVIQDKRVMGKIMVPEEDDDEEEEDTRASHQTKRHTVKSMRKLGSNVQQKPAAAPPPPIQSTYLTPAPQLPKDETTKFTSLAKAELTKKLEEANIAIQARPNNLKSIPGVRTFRLWHPTHKRRSLLVKIGGTVASNQEESEKIFNLNNIHAKSFAAWKKEAKLILPSATGGPPVENVEDLINATPQLQKDTDPKKIEQRIKRLSMASKGGDEGHVGEGMKVKKAVSLARDYAAVRKISKPDAAPLPKKDSDNSSYEDEDQDSGGDAKSNKETVIEIDSSDEEERIFKERKTAGIDIKGKLQTLKELTENLTYKREIRHHIVEKATGNTVLDAEYIPLKEHLLYLGEYIHDYLHDFFVSFMFWERSINEISGRFGVVTASYFIWLRRMVILNMFMFLTVLSIIVIPQILEDQEDENRAEVLAIHRIDIPFAIHDIFDGEGSFHHSYLFYSGYIHRNEKDHNPFRNPAFRFLLAITIIFMINTYFIFSHIGTFIQGAQTQSKVSGVSHNHNFTSIVCGWDWSCGSRTAAEVLRKSIRRELHILATTSTGTEKQTLEIETNKNKRLLAFLVKHFGLKWGSFVMHIISNILLIMCCSAIGSSIWSLCQVKLDYYINCIPTRDDLQVRTLNSSYWLCPDGSLHYYSLVMSFPALFASLATLSLSMVIVKVGEIESWETTERRVYATMTRAGTFYVTSLLCFYYFWISKETIVRNEGFVAETIYGKELYRLVVIKGLVDVVLNMGIKLIYHLIRRNSPNYKMTIFHPEYNAMNMFFLHFVGGMGTLFCPGLSFLVFLRMIVDFYIHRYALLNLSSHEGFASHASSVYGPYVITFLIGYLLTVFVNMFYLGDTQPSPFDGPFRMYNKTFFDVFRQDTNGKLLRYMRIILEPGFLAALIAIIAAILYFCRQWANAYEPIIRQLNDQIALDRADRDTLLKAIFEIGMATSAVPQVEEERKSFKRKRFPTAPTLASSVTTTLRISSAAPTPLQSATEATKPTAIKAPPKKELPRSSLDERAGIAAAKDMEGKKKDKELKKLIKQVQTDVNKDAPKVGPEKDRKDSGVHVDTWNAQRHRREHMEKIVKGIVGARRAAREETNRLNYDPTSKIFPKQEGNSSGNSSASSNASNKSNKSTKENKGNVAPAASKLAKHNPQPSSAMSLNSQQTGAVPSVSVTQHQQQQQQNKKGSKESAASPKKSPKKK